ncbi:ABC transporter ATP-binding protein [Corynebacterium kroppenstedtii]|uniref:ABC transporter ATP-binding protein n=1 Tax=Corynebacterium sp. PCR 32 TaxID=3351342 RepID=UPI00309D6833
MTTTTPAIDVRGVSQRFGRTTAINDLSLTIDTGDIVALLGPNGAGKSTLVDLIVGLNQPTRGTISIHGINPTDAIKRGIIGAALQDGGMLGSLTVGDLVDTLASIHPVRIDTTAVLQQAGLNTMKKKKVAQLSGGQRQRIRLALATMGEPRILLLDEPTTGLDITARAEFWHTVHTMANNGITILFATHDLTEAERYAGRVIIMNAGQIVADGTPEQLTSQYPTIIRASLAHTPSSNIDSHITALLAPDDTYERHGNDVLIHTVHPDHVLLHTLSDGLLTRPTVNHAELEEVCGNLTR